MSKKLLAIVIALVMAISLATPLVASADDYSDMVADLATAGPLDVVFVFGSVTIPAGDTVVIPADVTLYIFGDLTVNGILNINNALLVVAGGDLDGAGTINLGAGSPLVLVTGDIASTLTFTGASFYPDAAWNVQDGFPQGAANAADYDDLNAAIAKARDWIRWQAGVADWDAFILAFDDLDPAVLKGVNKDFPQAKWDAMIDAYLDAIAVDLNLTDDDQDIIDDAADALWAAMIMNSDANPPSAGIYAKVPEVFSTLGNMPVNNIGFTVWADAFAYEPETLTLITSAQIVITVEDDTLLSYDQFTVKAATLEAAWTGHFPSLTMTDNGDGTWDIGINLETKKAGGNPIFNLSDVVEFLDIFFDGIGFGDATVTLKSFVLMATYKGYHGYVDLFIAPENKSDTTKITREYLRLDVNKDGYIDYIDLNLVFLMLGWPLDSTNYDTPIGTKRVDNGEWIVRGDLDVNDDGTVDLLDITDILASIHYETGLPY